MAGRRAGPRNAGDYSIDLHIGINGISGAVWYCTERHAGSAISEHVSDFPVEGTLWGALTMAEKIIRLDRDGRQAQARVAGKAAG